MGKPAMGFWAKLKRPFTALAPMANVTDEAFRRMFIECGRQSLDGARGRPDVFWTEFVSVEGLLSAGREKLLVDLWYDKKEHPIVAQVFGGRPEQFEKIGSLIRELGFDGLDINMGCPDKSIERSGGGAALIKNPALAKEIIQAAKRGAFGLPVSVKTRIGYTKDESAKWLPALLEEGIAALTVHLRTRKEMSAVPAHWETAPAITAMRDRVSPKTLLIGNGDINTLEEAQARARESGLDGIMIGRGAFGDPWFFSGRVPDTRERLERLAAHAELFEKLYKSDRPGRIKRFDIMKKHFKAYVSGFDEAKELRVKLMEAENATGIRRVIDDFNAKRAVV